jgi:hypothetical protein
MKQKPPMYPTNYFLSKKEIQDLRKGKNKLGKYALKKLKEKV